MAYLIASLSSIIFLTIVFIFCLSFMLATLSFAPWVPSRRRDLERIFSLVELKPGQIFYELGCGDGRVTIYAARHFPAEAIGLEFSLPMYLLCKIKQIFFYRKNLHIKFKNLYYENLSKADVIYFFAIPRTLNQKFLNKLKKELKRGAKVISYSFRIDGLTPVLVSKPSDKDLPIYLYEF